MTSSTEQKVIYCNGEGVEVTEDQHSEWVYELDDLIEAAAVFCEGMAEGSIGKKTEDAGKFRMLAGTLNDMRDLVAKLLIL